MKTPSVFETYPHGIYTEPQTDRNKTTYSLFKGFIKNKKGYAIWHTPTPL